MVAFPWQAARPAHGKVHTAILAGAQADSTLPRGRWMVGIEMHVARHKQIQQAISIVVTPGWPRGPPSKTDAGCFSHVGERPIVVVVVETILAIVRDVDVR